MAQHKENDFVIPVLKTIKNCREDCTTEYIKRNVHTYIELTEEDLLPYSSRSKNEPRYYQIIGNLISHKNVTLFTYADFTPINDNEGNPTFRRKFSLNKAGQEYLKTLVTDAPCTSSASRERDAPHNDIFETFEYFTDKTEEQDGRVNDFTITDPFDAKIMEYALKHGLGKRPPTDSKIVSTVVELNGYKCEYGSSIGKRHNLFVGKHRYPFMEGHHLVPMKATKDFFPLNLDRPSNIVSLCPGCHSLLHHASKDEKAVVLKILYDNHIKQLNTEGIYISFEKLLEKYY